ncbi:hypothetical protein EG329_001651 [Mollisiaceae sp. DMI_Dod_QoI]|nr:hypothetical protein EG329_001651 [Helotiales sp. DMI_Dod_QoI]
MRSFICLGFTATFAAFVGAESTSHSSIYHSKLKRDFLTCQETYGGGSTTCGPVGSHFCYDPTVGESCCPLDDGYCGAGDFCAPVAGYCCHNTETPGVCAKRLNFIIIPSSGASSFPVAPAKTSAATSTSTLPALELTTSTIQIALAPGPPSVVLAGMGDAVSTTTQGTMVPEMTAPVDMANSTATVTATAGGIALPKSAPTFLQASAGVVSAKLCFSFVMAVVGFVGLTL